MARRQSGPSSLEFLPSHEAFLLRKKNLSELNILYLTVITSMYLSYILFVLTSSTTRELFEPRVV